MSWLCHVLFASRSFHFKIMIPEVNNRKCIHGYEQTALQRQLLEIQLVILQVTPLELYISMIKKNEEGEGETSGGTQISPVKAASLYQRAGASFNLHYCVFSSHTKSSSTLYLMTWFRETSATTSMHFYTHEESPSPVVAHKSLYICTLWQPSFAYSATTLVTHWPVNLYTCVHSYCTAKLLYVLYSHLHCHSWA
jgi:hypothetical protein